MSEQNLPPFEHQPDLTDYSFDRLVDMLVNDPNRRGQSRDRCQLDPRDGSMILYAEHRSLRRDEQPNGAQPQSPACPICSGQLTQVVDVAKLSEGFSFISQNMFPMFYPENADPELAMKQPLYDDPEHSGRQAYGFHLLQWTSSFHNRDWHNLPFQDDLTVMLRLQALEDKLLRQSAGYMPVTDAARGTHGYVSIIKNFGASAGASLSHAHQQIAFSNIMPQRTYNNEQFYKRHDQTFSDYLWHDNPGTFTVAENGCTRTIVPYFMRRPFNTLILVKTQAQHLHELTLTELSDLTQALQRMIRCWHLLMPELGRDISFNMAIHTGPKNHVYVEFFPIIQGSGGFERIGLWVCQLTAEHAAEHLRAVYPRTEFWT